MTLKRRQKKAYLLVEVLVAISLLLTAGFAFFEIEKTLMREAKKSVIEGDKERVFSIATAYLIEGIHDKKFDLSDIDNGVVTTINLEDAEGWQAIYEFTKDDDDDEDDDDEPKTPPQAFITSVKISITHPGDELQYSHPTPIELCFKKTK